MFKLKGPAMLQGSYSPAFPLKHQQKDMRLALALGDENAVSMPVSAAANEVRLHSLPTCVMPHRMQGLSENTTLPFSIAGIQEGQKPGAGGPGFLGSL